MRKQKRRCHPRPLSCQLLAHRHGLCDLAGQSQGLVHSCAVVSVCGGRCVRYEIDYACCLHDCCVYPMISNGSELWYRCRFDYAASSSQSHPLCIQIVDEWKIYGLCRDVCLRSKDGAACGKRNIHRTSSILTSSGQCAVCDIHMGMILVCVNHAGHNSELP